MKPRFEYSNRLFLTVLFVAAVAMSFGSVQEYMLPDGVTPRKVSAANPLPTTATIASVTITASGALDTRITSQTITLDTRITSSTVTLAVPGPSGFASDPIFNIATGNVQASISGGGATNPLFITGTGTMNYGAPANPNYVIATGAVTGAAANPVYTYATGTLPGPSGWATDPAYIWATGTLNGPTCWATNPAYLVATGANIDSTTDAINIVDYAHHEIHGGGAFTVTSTTQSLTDNASSGLLLVTPNTTKWAHLEWETNLEYKGLVEIFEGTTTSATGTAITIFNRNRNSATTATVACYPVVSTVSLGTLIRQIYVGLGKTSVGMDRGTAELILKQNTAYLFRITNLSGSSAGYTNLKLDWYEHTNH